MITLSMNYDEFMPYQDDSMMPICSTTARTTHTNENLSFMKLTTRTALLHINYFFYFFNQILEKVSFPIL